MIPTCFVLMSHGPVIVNVEDYTPDMGPLCDEKGSLIEGQQAVLSLDPVQPVAPVAPVDPVPPAPPVYFLQKSGKKHFAVGIDGKRVENVAGIDPAGYDTEADGWAAIKALTA